MLSSTYPKEWESFIHNFDVGTPVLTGAEIQTLLLQLQQFIHSQLPDSPDYDLKLQAATNAIFRASMILAEGTEQEQLSRASAAIYQAIKALIE